MTAPDAIVDAEVADRAGLELVARRTLVVSPIDMLFPLQPGDRPLVKEGEAVGRGQPIVEQVREPRTIVVAGVGTPEEPGHAGRALDRSRQAGRERARRRADGELLFRSGGRWRIARGERAETLEAPSAGVVHDRPTGLGDHHPIRRERDSRPARAGRPDLGPAPGRDRAPTASCARSTSTSARPGSIIVAGARMDAEALTRARAVGIRGVIVAALGIKEQRDFLASERRGRAAVHGLPPFGILVLDGAARRPIASPLMAMFEAIEGGMVAHRRATRRRSSSTIRASRCRRRRRTSSACGPGRSPAPRARGRDSPVLVASRPGSRSRRRSSGSAAARRSRSRSATSSALPDARVTIGTTGTARRWS